MTGWISRRQLAPLRVPGFRFLFYSTLASSLGTLVAAIALAIDVKDRTDSGVWVGAVLIVEFLPTIVVGLFFGPLLDRLERRSLMIGADLTRVAVFCALPFATSPGVIVALATVAGLANGFFRPAAFASVPNLVPEERAVGGERAPRRDRERQLGDRSDHRRCPHRGLRPERRVLDQRRLVPRLRRARRAHRRSDSFSPRRRSRAATGRISRTGSEPLRTRARCSPSSSAGESRRSGSAAPTSRRSSSRRTSSTPATSGTASSTRRSARVS